MDVYLEALRSMQRRYGAVTVLLATDDADGSVMRAVRPATQTSLVCESCTHPHLVRHHPMHMGCGIGGLYLGSYKGPSREVHLGARDVYLGRYISRKI